MRWKITYNSEVLLVIAFHSTLYIPLPLLHSHHHLLFYFFWLLVWLCDCTMKPKCKKSPKILRVANRIMKAP